MTSGWHQRRHERTSVKKNKFTAGRKHVNYNPNYLQSSRYKSWVKEGMADGSLPSLKNTFEGDTKSKINQNEFNKSFFKQTKNYWWWVNENELKMLHDLAKDFRPEFKQSTRWKKLSIEDKKEILDVYNINKIYDNIGKIYGWVKGEYYTHREMGGSSDMGWRNLRKSSVHLHIYNEYDIPNEWDVVVFVDEEPSDLSTKKTRAEAIKFAVSWMRKHPRG